MSMSKRRDVAYKSFLFMVLMFVIAFGGDTVSKTLVPSNSPFLQQVENWFFLPAALGVFGGYVKGAVSTFESFSQGSDWRLIFMTLLGPLIPIGWIVWRVWYFSATIGTYGDAAYLYADSDLLQVQFIAATLNKLLIVGTLGFFLLAAIFSGWWFLVARRNVRVNVSS